MTDTRGAQPESFAIQTGQPVLDDLQLRLKRARWPSAKDTDWSFGTDTGYLRDLTTYWQARYDWRAHEAELNRLSPFRARVDGKNIFFLHQRGSGRDHELIPTPLLLLHGWPDSFHRFHKVIDTLTNPAMAGHDITDSFDVVVPSQPGFAFTEHQPAADRPIKH